MNRAFLAILLVAAIAAVNGKRKTYPLGYPAINHECYLDRHCRDFRWKTMCVAFNCERPIAGCFNELGDMTCRIMGVDHKMSWKGGRCRAMKKDKETSCLKSCGEC